MGKRLLNIQVIMTVNRNNGSIRNVVAGSELGQEEEKHFAAHFAVSSDRLQGGTPSKL